MSRRSGPMFSSRARRRARARARWGQAALVVAVLALVLSMTGLAGAAKRAVFKSTKPKPFGVLRLDRHAKVPLKVLPKVRSARNADRVGGRRLADVLPSCPPTTVDLGTWCLDAATYAPTTEEIGKNDYFFATQKCVSLGGFLPSAAQLVGAAARVKLNSTIDDNDLTAAIDEDPSDGIKDKREMSSTLITTQAGSSAAGSEGVTVGSRGDPNQNEPNPTPRPADPVPDTLQYVTVYDNHDHGGFAGGVPVGQPQPFRCAYEKKPGASSENVS